MNMFMFNEDEDAFYINEQTPLILEPAPLPPPPVPVKETATLLLVIECLLIWVISHITRCVLYLKPAWASESTVQFDLRTQKARKERVRQKLFTLPVWASTLLMWARVIQFIILFCITALVMWYYVLPAWASAWNRNNKTDLQLKSIEFLALEHIPLYFASYNSHRGIIEHLPVNAGVPSTEHVDLDGNGIDDDLEANAVAIFIKEVMTTTPIHSIESIAVPSVGMAPAMVLARITQFDADHHHQLVVRAAFWDLLKLMLDRKFNPLYIKLVVKDYINRIEIRDKYSNEVRILKHVEDQSQPKPVRHNTNDFQCICSTHLGIADNFVYFAHPGKPSTLLIDPKIEKHLVGTNPYKEASEYQTVARYEFTNSPELALLDNALWDYLGFDQDILQPTQKLVSYKSPPPESYMLDYYGTRYGPAHVAYLNAFANHTQIRADAERGTKGQNPFEIIGNSISGFVHWFESTTNPLIQEYESYKTIVDLRELRRIEINDQARQKKPPASSLTDLMGIFKTTIKGSAIMQIPYLETHKLEHFSDISGFCITHCLGLHHAAMIRRQEVFDVLQGQSSQKHTREIEFEFL